MTLASPLGGEDRRSPGQDARIVMSIVAAQRGCGVNDLLSTCRASMPARHEAALLMERLIGLVPKQIDFEFGRRSFAHHALKAARRRLADDWAAQIRFDRLERLCLAALAEARKEAA